MGLDLTNIEHRAQIQRGLRYHWEYSAESRETRKSLIDIYRGKSSKYAWENDQDDPVVNLFQDYVVGHILHLAARSPSWMVKARTMEARGFDVRIQNFLRQYSVLLQLSRVFRQAALDSAFGRAIIKVITSIAPKGVHCPYGPRAFRISPDHFITDESAPTPDEADFKSDFYLVNLEDAQNHPGFRQDIRETLQPYTGFSSQQSLPDGLQDPNALIEKKTRLIDVYFPTLGGIAIWPANSDTFHDIVTTEPLAFIPSVIDPYSIVQFKQVPDRLEEVANLSSLRQLHFIANDGLHKMANQMRQSKRNPVGPIGSDLDNNVLLTAADGAPVFFSEGQPPQLYTLPGPDGSVTGTASLALQLFSRHGGNLEVALGQSAGSDTARQSQALIGQINARQSVDRSLFEEFVSSVGKKLATLAFYDEALELDILQRVPGTNYVYNVGWAPPDRLPRPKSIDDFHFELAPFSTAFRSPQERLQQLDAAAKGVAQWLGLKAQGAPVNLEAVIKSYSDAYDLVVDLSEWWNGEEPEPVDKTAQQYQSTMQHTGQTELTYTGSGGSPTDSVAATLASFA